MSFDKNEFYARTMHTPDSPERAALRSALRELSKVLIPLHRQLIETTRSDYSFAYQPVETPGHLLRLINEDPYFEWLKPMTAIIVEIDEMVRRDFDVSDVYAIGDRIQLMLSEARYLDLLQREADVAIGHAELRKALAKISRPA